MYKYKAIVDIYKNNNQAFDVLGSEWRGNYSTATDFKKAIIEHCQIWGYKYKIVKIERA